MEQMKIRFGVGLLLVAAGIFLLLAGPRLGGLGNGIEGEILSVKGQEDAVGQVEARVRFFLDGQGYEGTLSVPRDTYFEGERIWLRYDPRDPQRIRLAEPILLPWIGGAIGWIGLGILVWAAWKGRRTHRQREETHGETI